MSAVLPETARMLGRLKRLGHRALPAAPIAPTDEQLVCEASTLASIDMPRYPPFAKGLPVTTTAALMASQQVLIQRIQGTLRFDREGFDSIVRPVIDRYAAYVHLLPASEAHHHRGAGGLFRHGLEVGCWAAQKAQAHLFCVDETPQFRRDNEPRWQFAVFLGGLLHDFGKPVTDVTVSDRDGIRVWNPYDRPLVDWARETGIDTYFLRWRADRYRMHQKFSIINLDQVITPAARHYLNEPGPVIMEAMLSAISGLNTSDPLSELVLWADRESVKVDLSNQRLDVDEYAYGVPVERFIFDALRRLVSRAKVNEPGATIWRVEDSLFLVWKAIVPEILHVLSSDGVPGIPRSPETLADILIERGLATPCSSGEEGTLRYWRIYPEALGGLPLICLRLDDLGLVFTNEPPAATVAAIRPPSLSQARPPVQDAAQELSADPTPPSAPEPPRDPAPTSVTVPRNEPQSGRYTVVPWDTIESRSESLATSAPAATQQKARLDSSKVLSVPLPGQAPSRVAPTAQLSDVRQAEQSLGWRCLQQLASAIDTAHQLLILLPDGRYAVTHEALSAWGEPAQVVVALTQEGLLHRVSGTAPQSIDREGKRLWLLSNKADRYLRKRREDYVEPGQKPVVGNEKLTPSLMKGEDRAADPPSPCSDVPGAPVSQVSATKRPGGKLPSQQVFKSELTKQLLAGEGAYIAGPVKTEALPGNKTRYLISSQSMERMAACHGVSPTSVRQMLISIRCVVDLKVGSITMVKRNQ